MPTLAAHFHYEANELFGGIAGRLGLRLGAAWGRLSVGADLSYGVDFVPTQTGSSGDVAQPVRIGSYATVRLIQNDRWSLRLLFGGRVTYVRDNYSNFQVNDMLGGGFEAGVIGERAVSKRLAIGIAGGYRMDFLHAYKSNDVDFLPHNFQTGTVYVGVTFTILTPRR